MPKRLTSIHWPLAGVNITAGPGIVADRDHLKIPLTVTLSLAEGVDLGQDATLDLLYIVNGSLDYSDLFTKREVKEHETVTFQAQKTQTSFTIMTRPLAPGSMFELEVIPYPASGETIVSGPEAAEIADEKSLKTLNLLSTVALVTALGALALVLLKRKD